MHLLQPLDVDVYKLLKEGCRKDVEKFMIEHPGVKPDCYDINRPLANAYRGVLQAAAVCHSFAKTGLLTFSRDAISDYAIAQSLFTERKAASDNKPGVISEKEKSKNINEDVLQLPVCKTGDQISRNNPAKVFLLSGLANQPTQSASVIKKTK
jgi:hypothetical protein